MASEEAGDHGRPDADDHGTPDPDDHGTSTLDDHGTPDADEPWRDLGESELAALHDVEVGTEWLQRAHGHLLAFHHAVGHGMNRFDAAERGLRDAGHVALADELRDDLLPRGVVDDVWSYGLVEAYEEGLLAATVAFADRTRADLADGERHVAERRQQHRRRERAREGGTRED